MDQIIVIPTLDPRACLISLVDDLKDSGFKRFVIVDDGSAPGSEAVFASLGARGCAVLHHEENRGKGAAIKTAIDLITRLHPHAPGVITVDGDGQHLPADVVKVAEESACHPGGIVLGARQLHKPGVPLRSRVGNGFSSAYFKFDTGRTCQDTQTGLRGIPRNLLPFARSVEGERYEYEMNFLTQAAKNGVPFYEVPIATVYEDGNATSHFDTVRDSYHIYRSFIRFTASSLSCSAVDLGLFALLTFSLDMNVALLVAVATVSARMASGALNFAFNRRWSFEVKAEGRTGPQALRYGVLFVAQMLASMTLVAWLSFAASPLVLIKVFVDSALFIVSYFVQRNWVFAKKKAVGGGAGRESHVTQTCANANATGEVEQAVVGVAVWGDSDSVRDVRAAGYVRHP